MAGAAKLSRARASLGERLQARRVEIEQAILTRVYGVSDTSGIGDPEYAEGLRVAISVAVVYGIASIQHGEERVPPVPPALLIQARTAARAGISLDTVLRRYVAGYGLLGDFLIEEAAKGGVLEEEALKGALRVQTGILDRLLAAVSEEYEREADARTGSAEARRAEQVQRLLDGELVDASKLGYDLEGHHVGLAATGPDALDVVQALDRALDCRSLIVPRGETTIWAWLGARRKLEPSELTRAAAGKLSARASIAVGEQGEGLSGWRLTHEQARAALSVATRQGNQLVHYRDVSLLASMLQDDLLRTSLQKLYLAPFMVERDGGAALKKTLRAYFAAERNVSSAASALGVSRRTVANRLRTIEERIGRPLNTIGVEMELALRLDALETDTKY